MAQILIVDDALLTRQTMARLLEHEGYSTETAANGRDAYAMLYTGTPQLIILDLMMPQMDGLTFLRLVRNSPHWDQLPVLVMSGFTEEDKLVARARKLGVVDVLSKGASDVEQLLKHVRQIVPVQKQVAPQRTPRKAVVQTAPLFSVA
jgi:CheY-like chemotaxis protein